MATHSRILAWRIPWTEEPGGLQSMESQRIGHGWSDLAQMHTEDLKNLPKVTPSFLSMCVAGISPFHADSWTNQLNGANQSDSCSWKEEQALSLWNNRWEKKKKRKWFSTQGQPMCTEPSCWKYLRNAPFFLLEKWWDHQFIAFSIIQWTFSKFFVSFDYTFSWRRQCTPLQCSCLENPMDRGAWWAAVHEVAKSRTRLKWLSSSSSSSTFSSMSLTSDKTTSQCGQALKTVSAERSPRKRL